MLNQVELVDTPKKEKRSFNAIVEDLHDDLLEENLKDSMGLLMSKKIESSIIDEAIDTEIDFILKQLSH